MLKRIEVSKPSLSILILAGLGVLLLYLASQVFAATGITSLTASKSSYGIGEPIVLTGVVDTDGSTDPTSYTITLAIAGTQTMTTQNITFTSGTQTFNTDSDADDTDELSVVVTYTASGATLPGTLPGTLPAADSEVTITATWSPDALQDPAPVGLSNGTMTNPEWLFNVPGATFSQTQGTVFPDAQWVFPVPFVPQTSNNVLGISDAGSNDTNSIYVLLDGGGPNDMDKVIKLDKNNGQVKGQAFQVGTSKALGIAVAEVGGTEKLLVVAQDTTNIRVLGLGGGSAQNESDDLTGILSMSGGTPSGMAYDYSNKLLYVAEEVMQLGDTIEIDVIDMSGGAPEYSTTLLFDSYNIGETGFKSLAYHSTSGELLAAYDNGGIAVLDASYGGMVLNTSLSGGPGAAFGMGVIGNDFYFGDPSGIYKTTRAGATAGAKNPNAMATDGTYLYVVIDGQGQPDTIQKLTMAGVLEATINPAGNDKSITGLEYYGSSLYYITNDAVGSEVGPVLVSINPSSGASNSRTDLGTTISIGALVLGEDAAEADTFYAVAENQNLMWPITASTLAVGNYISITATGMMNYPLGGYGAAFNADNEVMVANFQDWAAVGAVSGSIINNMNVMNLYNPQGHHPVGKITGATRSGNSVWFVDYDNQAVYGLSKPGAVAADTTIAGTDYVATLTIVTQEGTLTATDTFDIVKVTPAITITSPVPGSAIAAGDLDVNGLITVTGSVNDYTMIGSSITIGVIIPDQEIIADAVTSATTSTAKWTKSGLWHVADLSNSQMPALYTTAPDNYVYWYGNPNTGNFSTGSANSGDLTIVSSVAVIDANTSLTFMTWWNTEFATSFDQKLVQYSEDNGTTWTNLAQIVDPGAFMMGGMGGMGMGGGMGGGGGGGGGCGNDCTQINVEPGPFKAFVDSTGKGWASVTVSLSTLVGKTVKLRFYFDTVDPYGNEMEGWFVDDVKVTGQSSSGTSSTVQSDLSFSGTFAPSEGENSLTASGNRSAYDSVALSEAVSIFLDNVAPTITFDAVTSPTSTATQAITGTVTDPTANELKITLVNTAFGFTVESPLTAALDKSPPTDGSAFSKTISVFEGTNVITVKVTDKGNNITTLSKTIVLDTVGPSLTVYSTLYPVGEDSARPGDLAVLQVKAEDAASGVASVSANLSGTPTSFVARATIPDFFLDQWGVNAGATHILPATMPSLLASGLSTFALTVTDNSGNSDASNSATATITPSLTKYNIYLLDGWNLVSTPLTLDNSAWTSAIPAPDGVASTILDDAVTIVWYYDALTAKTDAASAWKKYTPSTSDTDTMTTFEPGRGYWINVDGTKLATASQVAPGVSVKPPAKLTVEGTFLEPGVQGLPPIITVYAGWNLIGFHSENSQLTSQGLQAVTVGPSGQTWASLLQYDNFVTYQGANTPVSKLGAFSGLTLESTMTVGNGFWLFMLQDGQIVPTN